MDLAFGFPENEKVATMDFLLARPWQELLNAGQITDRHGNGFFCITQEGYKVAVECGSLSNGLADPGTPVEIGNRGRIADLRFRKAAAEIYEGTIQHSKHFVDQYEKEGIASGGWFLQRVADAVLTQFKTIEKLFEAAYASQFENEPITPPIEQWLRAKARETVESEVVRALEVKELLSSSFAGPSAESFRLEAEGRMMLQRLDDSIMLLKLANDERVQSTIAPTSGAKKLRMTPEATDRGLRVFISHSSKDTELALALIDLLKAGLGLVADQIRCSSVDGSRLPVGVNTQGKLRQEVNAATVVVGLITPSSLVSYYVMFELGARWGADLFLAPLLAGVKASELSGPLGLLNALSANSEAQLHQLLDDISKHLGLPLQPAASYVRHVSLVKKLVDSIPNGATPSPRKVPEGNMPQPERAEQARSAESQDAFADDLVQHVRQAVGRTMTLSGQLLLRWLLIQGRVECPQQFMPEIALDTQNKQMEIAVKAGIVRREQEQSGLRRTFYIVNTELKPALQGVLPELLAETQTPR
jgi:hypothetical protein